MQSFDDYIQTTKDKHQITSQTLNVACLHCGKVISYRKDEIERLSEWRYYAEKNCPHCGLVDVLRIRRY